MEGKKMPPIGVENFEKLRKNDYYYVDKTELIRDLLQNRADVTLFTRPRRFGKSLNMSMLGRFFSVEGDKSIFDGLEISKEAELCEKRMGKYPVISLSLKKIDRPTYEKAFQMAADVILETAENFQFLLDSENLSEHEKDKYWQLLDENMSERTLIGSLKLLSKLLAKHYGTKAIILIDEYDVPLQKAFVNGYYDQMVSLIRSLLSDTLKTNDNLEFAVLTGCLRVAKESIFQDQIVDLFFEEAKEDGESLQILCQAIAAGDADGLHREGCGKVLKYGVACYKKQCKALLG